jgi:hypothetical protein
MRRVKPVPEVTQGRAPRKKKKSRNSYKERKSEEQKKETS